MTNRQMDDVYPKELMASAAQRQIKALNRLKKERHNKDVNRHLKSLKHSAQDETKNLLPDILDCVKSYATLQEICDVLRDVFGEAKPASL
jgi:methylmalonyl-CoA mutase N-terminal domain/subunit